MIISTFFAVLLFNPNLRPNVWDSYEYFNVGKSLSQGKGNLQIWNPEEPTHWLKTNIPDNSIILTRDSSLCFLISGHKSVSLENAKGINDVNRLINFPNVDYVIANPYYKNTHEKFLFDVIRQNSDKFLQIYGKNDDNVRVFKIIKSSWL